MIEGKGRRGGRNPYSSLGMKVIMQVANVTMTRASMGPRFISNRVQLDTTFFVFGLHIGEFGQAFDSAGQIHTQNVKKKHRPTDRQ